MSKIVYFNGKFVKFNNAKISIEDRGFQFSDSIYEVIAFKNSNFIDLRYHLIRLRKSLKSINIKYRFKDKDLEKKFYKLISLNKIFNGLIYMQITRGVQARSHAYKKNLTPTSIIYIINKNFDYKTNKLIAKTAITYPDLRWKKRNIKSVSLLANVLAAAEASKKSSYEAILIENGYVTEGTASNIWIIKNKTIRTHPANSDILRGITRDSVKKLIRKYKLRLIEKKIKKKSLYESDEVFLTSSSNFVTPIIKIDNKLINKGRIGNITMELAKLYKLRIN